MIAYQRSLRSTFIGLEPSAGKRRFQASILRFFFKLQALTYTYTSQRLPVLLPHRHSMSREVAARQVRINCCYRIAVSRPRGQLHGNGRKQDSQRSHRSVEPKRDWSGIREHFDICVTRYTSGSNYNKRGALVNPRHIRVSQSTARLLGVSLPYVPPAIRSTVTYIVRCPFNFVVNDPIADVLHALHKRSDLVNEMLTPSAIDEASLVSMSTPDVYYGRI